MNVKNILLAAGDVIKDKLIYIFNPLYVLTPQNMVSVTPRSLVSSTSNVINIRSIINNTFGAPKSYIKTRYNSRSKPYLYLPKKQKKECKYWIEEHRTPKKGKSSLEKLTQEEIKQLKRGEQCDIHYDVRIQIDKDHIISFVTRREFPTDPRKRILAILQPRHYKQDKLVISRGYGKGIKQIIKQGRCDVWANNNMLHFQLEGEKWTPGFALVPIKNSTNNYYIVPLKPYNVHAGKKTKMTLLLRGRDDELIEQLIKDNNVVASAKKDGARANISMEREGDYIKLYIGSYREDKRLKKLSGGQSYRINYNDKLQLYEIYDPNRTIEPRDISVEIWTKSNTGLSPSITPKLQYNAWKARRQRFKFFLYPHTVYDEKMDYRARWDYLRSLRDKTGGKIFKRLPQAITEKGKRNLIEKCERENNVDGTVFYNLETGKYYKLKFPGEYDAKIIDIKLEKSSSNSKTAIPIVRFNNYVGPMSGSISRKTKQDIYARPEDYIGGRVEFRATELTKNGAPFQPVITKVEPYY